MQGGIAQIIGLVLAANARQRGMSPAGWPDGSIYQFCDKVRFLGRQSNRFLGFRKSVEIDDPTGWLETMPQGMERAQLAVVPRNDPNISDRESVGFANGGPVFLAQIIARDVESWCGDWRVTNQADPEQRIWSVTYRNISNVPVATVHRSIEEVRRQLSAVLDDAIRFSETHNMSFAVSFVAAQRALDERFPLTGFYHADMVPEGLLTLGHLQILSCAARAWVFGGMGSWNDVWFEGADQDTYRELSDRLFSAILDGLVLSTNASATAADAD